MTTLNQGVAGYLDQQTYITGIAFILQLKGSMYYDIE